MGPEPGMAVHVYNPTTQESEAETLSWLWGYPRPYGTLPWFFFFLVKNKDITRKKKIRAFSWHLEMLFCIIKEFVCPGLLSGTTEKATHIRHLWHTHLRSMYHVPTVGWALLHPLATRKCPQTCPQANIMEEIPQLGTIFPSVSRLASQDSEQVRRQDPNMWSSLLVSLKSLDVVRSG